MKNFKHYVPVLLIMLFMASCSKDNGTNAPPTVPEKENQAPTITAQVFNASEDIDDAVIIGKIIGSDTDNDDLTFSITTNSNNLFELTDTGSLSLTVGQMLDFETSISHQIKVEVSDGIATNQAAITITVDDVDEGPAPEGSIPFITTWKTTIADQMITIPTFPFGGFTYDYTVDWGDGTSSSNQMGDATHVYMNAGDYDISITGRFPSIYFGFAPTNVTVIKNIKQWGNIAWESFRSSFYLCVDLEHSATDRPNLSKVTDASAMFAFATKINFDASDWQVGSITNMSSMFLGARTFTSDLSSWDVSNVTDMSSMFNTAPNFNSNLNTWDVRAVLNMDQMFSGARIYNQNLDQWNVGNVTKMSGMFDGAVVFNSDLSTWNVSNVTDMEAMFNGAIAFNKNIGAWNVVSVVDMSNMLDNTNIDVGNYDAILKGWSELAGVPSEIHLDATGLTYCTSGETARNILIGLGWNIDGDSKSLTCR